MVASEDFSDEDFVAVSSCIVLVLAVALAGLSYTGIDIAVSEERHTQDVIMPNHSFKQIVSLS